MAGNLSIMVVDDDPNLLGIIAMRLEMVGYHVVTSSEAWATMIQTWPSISKSQEQSPGLAVMDIQMAGAGSGVEAYRKLRSLSPKMPVIFMSGMDPLEAAKIVPTSDPLVRFVPKPIDFARLRIAIKELTGVDRPI